MGGKNPTIISRKADLDLAAMGVMRSAFGLQGQKCSACSRVYVEHPAKEAFIGKLLKLTQSIMVGNPLKREVWLGPVINKKAYTDYMAFCRELREAGRILHGGEYVTEGDLGKGYFCKPTIVDRLPLDHPLWKKEMFLPIVTVAGVENLAEAMSQANAADYGLTAGFFSSSPKEIEWFLNNIQAGVTYVNRQAGATTGAWPGYQAFGGWKGSGSTGKAGGSLYYLPQFMREQSRTLFPEEDFLRDFREGFYKSRPGKQMTAQRISSEEKWMRIVKVNKTPKVPFIDPLFTGSDVTKQTLVSGQQGSQPLYREFRQRDKKPIPHPQWGSGIDHRCRKRDRGHRKGKSNRYPRGYCRLPGRGETLARSDRRLGIFPYRHYEGRSQIFFGGGLREIPGIGQQEAPIYFLREFIF